MIHQDLIIALWIINSEFWPVPWEGGCSFFFLPFHTSCLANISLSLKPAHMNLSPFYPLNCISGSKTLTFSFLYSWLFIDTVSTHKSAVSPFRWHPQCSCLLNNVWPKSTFLCIFSRKTWCLFFLCKATSCEIASSTTSQFQPIASSCQSIFNI